MSILLVSISLLAFMSWNVWVPAVLSALSTSMVSPNTDDLALPWPSLMMVLLVCDFPMTHSWPPALDYLPASKLVPTFQLQCTYSKQTYKYVCILFMPLTGFRESRRENPTTTSHGGRHCGTSPPCFSDEKPNTKALQFPTLLWLVCICQTRV